MEEETKVERTTRRRTADEDIYRLMKMLAWAVIVIIFVQGLIVVGLKVQSDNTNKIINVQKDMTSASARGDCIRDIQGTFFYDLGSAFGLNPLDTEAYKAFVAKMQQDAIDIKNSGDICQKKLQKEKK